jgi:hypothetical protein
VTNGFTEGRNGATALDPTASTDDIAVMARFPVGWKPIFFITTAFVRIHRSTIVNLDRIRELQPDFNGDQVVLLADGTKLSLGRSYRDRLQTRLGAES